MTHHPEQIHPEAGTPKLGKVHRVAAGLPAVANALGIVAKEMGVVRGLAETLRLNQLGGIDCQSCAWPSPDSHRHLSEFCENGAKALASEGTLRRVTAEFFAKYSVAQMREYDDHWLEEQGRLTHPMVLLPNATHYVPITWDDAFNLIAKEARNGSPEELAWYTSGRASNEAAFAYQLMVRKSGSNNLPDCSNMCHESSGVALGAAIGLGKGSVTLEDFHHADCIVIAGQNPGTNHPRMMSSLQAAARNGAKIIAINPISETGLISFVNPQDLKHPIYGLPALLGFGTPLATDWLQVRLSGDMALFRGFAKVMVEAGFIDKTFIGERCLDYAEYEKIVRQTDWAEIELKSGIARKEIERVGRIIGQSKKLITCWAMGLTQGLKAVDTIREVVNLHLLNGQIGRQGAGLCPVRGHSNVQGNRTVGIFEQMPEPFLAKLEEEFHFTCPREHGFDVVGCIKKMLGNKVRLFFGLGGNFFSATPDSSRMVEAFANTNLSVHVSTKLHRGHLYTGKTGLILPCKGRSEIDLQASGEQFITTEDSMGVINFSRGDLTPASPDLLSETSIICRLARKLLKEEEPWASWEADYGKIRKAIQRVVPGFEGYDTIEQTKMFHLPNGPREGKFTTPSRKAVFGLAEELPEIELKPGQYSLQTLRSHDQFNTTIYNLNDRYRGVYNGRKVVFMNEADIKREGWQAGLWVDIQSCFEGTLREVKHWMVTPFQIAPGTVAVYFPEGNSLIALEHTTAGSNTPISKFVPVTIKQSADQTEGLKQLQRKE